jgi:hypothetical protein
VHEFRILGVRVPQGVRLPRLQGAHQGAGPRSAGVAVGARRVFQRGALGLESAGAGPGAMNGTCLSGVDRFLRSVADRIGADARASGSGAPDLVTRCRQLPNRKGTGRSRRRRMGQPAPRSDNNDAEPVVVKTTRRRGPSSNKRAATPQTRQEPPRTPRSRRHSNDSVQLQALTAPQTLTRTTARRSQQRSFRISSPKTPQCLTNSD